MTELHDSSPIPVVGIGASAGGLEALEAFFDALPDESGLAFAVVMHLPPDRESNLAELLQRRTSMPVAQVTEATNVEPNRVYVIPPDRKLRVGGGRFDVTAFEEPHGRRMPIDFFFRSLAETRGDGAAVVLSGTGPPGAVRRVLGGERYLDEQVERPASASSRSADKQAPRAPTSRAQAS